MMDQGAETPLDTEQISMEDRAIALWIQQDNQARHFIIQCLPDQIVLIKEEKTAKSMLNVLEKLYGENAVQRAFLYET